MNDTQLMLLLSNFACAMAVLVELLPFSLLRPPSTACALYVAFDKTETIRKRAGQTGPPSS